MNRRIVIALFALAMLAHRAHAVQAAAQHANVEKGFRPGQAYSASDLDQINLFNGNLNVTIPIGGVYKAGGSLSYKFTLAYSGNNWEYEQKYCVIGQEPAGGGQIWGWAQWADPFRRHNAGMGWLFSLGRIYSHVDTRLPMPHFSYQSPDGADHTLYPGLHSNYSEGTPRDLNFTRDGTWIRHTVLRNANQQLTGHQLEFTDGNIHVFDANGLISEMRDRFDNHVTIQRYPANTAGIPAPDATACGTSYVTWKVSDRHRAHYIYFQLTPGYPFMKERVCQASLAAFDDARANYLFRYVDRHVSRQKTSPDPYNPSDKLPPTLQVPILTKVELPTQTSYALVYDIGIKQEGTNPAVGVRSDSPNVPTHVSDLLTNQLGGYSGHLIELKLPTLARYEWQYRRYSYPPDYERHPRLPEEMLPPTFSAGVATRKVYANGGDPDVWTYTTSSLFEHLRTVAITTVTGPDGAKTDNYFSLWSSGTDRDYDYGLPFTRKVMTGNDPTKPLEYPNPRDGMYLSTVTFLPDNKKRLTYVLYERDPVFDADTQRDDNRRVKARMTVFEDLPEKVTKETYSSFDGLGHYRTTTTSATGGAIERVTTTNFNPGSPPDEVLWEDEEWLTEDYDFVETIDRDPVSQATLAQEKTEYCFDSTNGGLLRRRVLRDGSNDLLAVFIDADAEGDSVDGNVSQEAYYGGDRDLLPSSFNTCGGDPATLTLGYRVHHEYEAGALARSRYEGTSFNVIDLTIDPSSGLPSATRDSAGVGTTLHYDLLGRLTGARPAGRAWSEYVYTDASGTTGPGVIARQCSSGATNCSNGALSEARYYYDLLGRLTQQRLRIISTADASQWAATWTEYVNGRQSAVSVIAGESSGASGPMPAGTKQTKWLYDEVGRVTSIEQPDASFTLYSYPDSRRTERSTMVALTSTSSEWVTTTETTDFLGRLASVTEATGHENVTTSYRYDVGDRLITVNPGSVAERSFSYDDAGLLTSETQPESGTTSYTYDARGHALQMRTGDCHFDLNYTWDVAERLIRVDARDDGSVVDQCAAPGWRPMKEFVFEDDANTADRGFGKLRSAIRYNASSLGLVRVSETLTYGETGRVTDKQTAVDEIKINGTESLQTFEQRVVYDDLDRIVDNVYPVCIASFCGEAPYDGVRTSFDDRGVKSADAGWYSTTGGFQLRAPLATFRHAPNGLRVQTAHSNGVTDEVTPDPSGMVRPRQIAWNGFSATCSVPSISSGPASDPAVPHGQTRTLTVTAGGTGPLSYQWFDSQDPNNAIANATSPSFTTPAITEVRRYWVVVSGPCGKLKSATAVLTPFDEEPPDPPSSLTATRQGTTSAVMLQWNGSANAASYRIERRSGGVFNVVGTTSAQSWVDSSCAPLSACVYRVRAVASGGTQSGPGNHDLATLMSFSPANVHSTVSYEDLEGILDAINAIRAAAGLAVLTWAQVVPGSGPMEGGVIAKAHVLNLRSRMDEALAANGIPSPAYTDSVLSLFRYYHIEQLRERTQ